MPTYAPLAWVGLVYLGAPMTRKKIPDKRLDNNELESESFLERMRNTQISQGTLDLARQKYGYELPDDVIEVIARQQAAARPILEQYHTLHEQTPTLTIAKATMQKDIEQTMDLFCGMDLSDLGDIGDYEAEYSCPKCAHRWSGAPNHRTGYGGVVYVPTGKISRRTGKPISDRYGKPAKTVRNFTRGRDWKGASAKALPRGFGNAPIGEPIIGKSWRGKAKPPAGYERQ